MRLSPLTSILIACLLGAATLFTLRYFNATEPRPEPVQPVVLEEAVETRRIVVARSIIPAGSPIRIDDLKIIEQPVAFLPPDGYETFDDLALSEAHPRHALVDIAANSPLQNSRLSAPNINATLATRLRRGERAYAVRMDDVRGVAGLVMPGDHVDVLHTYNPGSQKETQQVATKIVLENIPVLALDFNADPSSDTPSLFKTATLAVTADQARLLSSAAQTGRVSLALRSALDKADTTDRTPLIAQLSTPTVQRTVPRRKPVRIVAPKPRYSDIEVVLGDAAETVTVPLQ